MEGEKLTVKVLKVGKLNALPHAENVGSTAEAVEQHPDVASVQSGNFVAGLAAGGAIVARDSVLDIGPGSNERGEDHKTKGEKGHATDAAAEPKDLAVCDQDDCQVLEDGVDRDGQELESLGTSVDHANEEEGDGEPCGKVSGKTGRVKKAIAGQGN